MLKEFLANRRGNTAIMFALALVPIFGSIGAAIDFSRAGAARTEMQATLDAVALMLSKEAVNLTADQLATKANNYFNSMFHNPDMQNIVLSPSFVTDNNTFHVRVGGTGSLDTTIAHLLGISQMQIGASAEVDWSMHRIELALALDNTGSMAALNKMTELKKATNDLLQTLQNTAKTPDQVKVAIVPFDTMVNVGVENKAANWLRFGGSSGSGSSGSGSGGTVTASNWTGCVTDRDQPNDVMDTTPTGDPATQFPAAQCGGTGSLVKMQPLTNNWTTLRQMVSDMTPSGNTNVTIGLEWAWHALSPNAPLTEGSAPKSDLDKVLVLLTDGTNTQNRFSKVASDIDARTQQACANIKASGIKVYTVRVIEGNAALLQGCASSPSMYFDVQQAAQLSSVFSQIGKMLANIRIAK